MTKDNADESNDTQAGVVSGRPATPSRRRSRRLPAFVAGRRCGTAATEEMLQFPTGNSIGIQKIDADFVEDLAKHTDLALARTPIHDILTFLYNVGQNWKSRQYSVRLNYERALIDYLGYSEAGAENEANWVAMLLSSTHRLYDAVALELGAWRILDDWVMREEALVRAFPRGKVLHILPGNVPLSTIVSVLRAVITKNNSVLKVSSDDPFTANALMQSFLEVDPDHAVTRSLSLTYWRSGSDEGFGRTLAQRSDVIVAWGGSEAINWARENSLAGAELILFGPKRSLSIVGPGADVRRAARAIAFDASLYDQRACFSSRCVYVYRPLMAAFLELLPACLGEVEKILPKGASSIDECANQVLTRLHSRFLGEEICTADNEAWSILTPGESVEENHCLGRTLAVYPFEELDELYAICGPEVQTVGVMPWGFVEQVRDGMARRGVSRFVECGFHNVFRSGGAHDGMYPLQKLVRVVGAELPSEVYVKGIHVRIDQTEIVESKTFSRHIP